MRRQADRYDSRCQHFNSRTHVECDVMMLGEITEDGISTHALTWSATSLVPSNVPDTRDFNSRTHVECDGCETMARNESYDFNSRTHVECDIGLTTTERRLFISTHALTWSATCTESIFSRQSSGFQLTHSRGVRRYAQSRKICQESFQLTHSRGVRRA